MKYVCALLTVENIERSRNFYETVLNQKVEFDFGENVSFGQFAIHLKSHYQILIEKDVRVGKNNVELYFEDDNIELLFELLKQQGVQFVHELREQPWKQKVFRLYDPDNYVVEIEETMESLCFRLSEEKSSHEEIARMTSLPIEFVQKAVEEFRK